MPSFNEAAALLPREACLPGRGRHTDAHGFNEAAALLPREANSRKYPAAGVKGFNEAAALLPREASTIP